MGPVHEKETSTKVKAMNIEPSIPPRSSLAVDLLTNQYGITISKAPKNEAANSIKMKKKRRLGSQWVLSQFAIPGPATTAKIEPIKT